MLVRWCVGLLRQLVIILERCITRIALITNSGKIKQKLGSFSYMLRNEYWWRFEQGYKPLSVIVVPNETSRGELSNESETTLNVKLDGAVGRALITHILKEIIKSSDLNRNLKLITGTGIITGLLTPEECTRLFESGLVDNIESASRFDETDFTGI